MIIVPIDVSLITRKVESLFKDDPALLATDTVIERGEPLNTDSARCPWVGIYKSGVAFPARTIGVGQGYRRQKPGLVIVAQAADINSGHECEDTLEALLQNLMRILLNNEGLGGLVDALDSVDISYGNYGKDGNVFVQSAVIQVVGVMNVSAIGG